MKSQLFKLTKEIVIQANDASTSEFDRIVPVDESDSGRDMLAYSLKRGGAAYQSVFRSKIASQWSEERKPESGHVAV
jgi:hypothetical protein